MGNRLKEKRLSMLMTQEELADAAGVSRTTIWAIENESNENFSLKTMKKLAEALKTSVQDLFFS